MTKRNSGRHRPASTSADIDRSPKDRRVGLARAMSKLGCCSRSQAAELIHSGRVCVNGRIARDMETPVRIGTDQIDVDGAAVRGERRVYYVLNKPRGVVTTASDEKGRDTVYDYLPDAAPWVGPAGRLDKASEGLLLLTNDSEWAARITAPETHLDKTYHVQIRGEVMTRQIQQMTAGGASANQQQLRAKSVHVLRRGDKNTWLVIVLDEGKNRQIRRILETLQLEVLRLLRVAIGPLELGVLAKGQCRTLTQAEKGAIDVAIGKVRSPEHGH